MKDSSTAGNSNSRENSSDSKEDPTMSDRENEENMIDPPENQGGGSMNLDSPAEDKAAIDPPSNDGGN
jgi:hypothetical protein